MTEPYAAAQLATGRRTGDSVGVRLLEPLNLGAAVAPNRVVFGAHETNLGWGRSLSDRHVEYYRRRAAGGVGTIVVEEASVHETDWPYERAPLAAECESGWASIASVVHEHGALVLASLGHAGGQGTSHWSQRELWAPSNVPEVNTREVPKAMEPQDIATVITGFADAARAAMAAGCDGVEVSAGQHSLVRQFLSGLTNQRGDEWGTDRLAFARQVLSEVRSSIGSEAVLMLRLSCDELAPWAGLTPELAVEVAVALAPMVDAITVVRGSIYTVSATRPDGHTPPGFNLDLAAPIRAAVSVPVIVQGSLVDWGQAEWAVGDGDRADGVEMTRALLADADLVAKLGRGEGDRVRPCILCNQTCQVRDNRNPPITCVVDPSTGHEYHEAIPGSASGSESTSRSIAVVGGGVGGLEAARVAAERGHRVTLIERSNRLGGAVLDAAAGAGRGRLAELVRWQVAEVERLGVDVRLATTHVPAGVDVVVVATGSAPGVVEYAVTRAAVRLTAAEVLAGAELPPGVILVWDPIGGPIAVSVAESLAAQGRAVELATPDGIVGNELSRSGDLAPANARLQRAGVVLHRRTLLRSVKKGSAEVEDRFSGERRTIRCSAIIDCGHRLPDETVYRELTDTHDVVIRVGDCVAPRTIHEAILEARRAIEAVEHPATVSDGVPMGRSDH